MNVKSAVTAPCEGATREQLSAGTKHRKGGKRIKGTDFVSGENDLISNVILTK